jgi:uncharacterized protein (DUF433 family)
MKPASIIADPTLIVDRSGVSSHILHVSAQTTIDIGTLITRSPGIKNGVPRIAGTGTTVRTIARLHQQGLSPEEIASSRYNLKLEQVHAALAYYFANRAEIEADFGLQDQESARIESEILRSASRK